MSSTAPPLSPSPAKGSGPNQHHQQAPNNQQPHPQRNGAPTSSYPPPLGYNYSQPHYPQPPTGYPSPYNRVGGPPSGYPQPGQPSPASGSYPPYQSYQPNGAGYPRTAQMPYHQPTAGPSRPGPNGLSNLLHPDGAQSNPNSGSPNQTPLSLPPIRPTSPTQSTSTRPVAPSTALKQEPGSAAERGPTPPMPLDPALAEPEPDLPVNLPPPGQAPAPQPKKRPFDDLLGATASLSATEAQPDRPNPAEQREAGQGAVTDENGDMLAFIVKKAVQMTNKAKLTAEAEEDDGQDKANGGPVKKFPCPHQLCGRKFARSWNLQAHLKSHLGIRDFSCPECGKLFSRKHDCTRHCIAIHLYNKDGTKPAATDAPPSAPAPGPVPAQQHQLQHAQPQPIPQQPQPQVVHQQLPIDPNADLAVGGPAQ